MKEMGWYVGLRAQNIFSVVMHAACRKDTIYILTYDSNLERVAAQPDATRVDALRVSWLPRARARNDVPTRILAQARDVHARDLARLNKVATANVMCWGALDASQRGAVLVEFAAVVKQAYTVRVRERAHARAAMISCAPPPPRARACAQGIHAEPEPVAVEGPAVEKQGELAAIISGAGVPAAAAALPACLTGGAAAAPLTDADTRLLLKHANTGVVSVFAKSVAELLKVQRQGVAGGLRSEGAVNARAARVRLVRCAWRS